MADYVEALKWYSLAASRASASQAEMRDLALTFGDMAANKMTPAQIARAQKLAREWKPE